jgi:hypothetical protein
MSTFCTTAGLGSHITALLPSPDGLTVKERLKTRPPVCNPSSAVATCYPSAGRLVLVFSVLLVFFLGHNQTSGLQERVVSRRKVLILMTMISKAALI